MRHIETLFERLGYIVPPLWGPDSYNDGAVIASS